MTTLSYNPLLELGSPARNLVLRLAGVVLFHVAQQEQVIVALSDGLKADKFDGKI
jgi:hypothetical protein